MTRPTPPPNTYQAATALGRRLRVRRADPAVAGQAASWIHPDHPGLAYVVAAAGDSGGWMLLHGGAGPIACGPMDAESARLHVSTATSADARRLAAWRMVEHLAVTGPEGTVTAPVAPAAAGATA